MLRLLRNTSVTSKTLLRSTIRTMPTKGAPEKARILSIEPLSSGEAKWTKLERITYQDPAGKTRLWECASRTTKPEGSEVDAVAILAILKKESGAEIILEKQFRPPTGGVCIELPAGLVDPKESVAKTAVRELYEETGYIGEVVSESVPIFADPGFVSANLSIVTCSIDLSDERNQNPTPQLEDGEFIEVFSLPLQNFDEEIKKLHSQGYKIDCRVQNIAEGLKLHQQFLI